MALQYIDHGADKLIDNTYAQGVGLDTLRRKVAEAVVRSPELETEFAKVIGNPNEQGR